MDTARGGSLRFPYVRPPSGIDQHVALPNLRIRALLPRERNEEERQPLRDAVLCL